MTFPDRHRQTATRRRGQHSGAAIVALATAAAAALASSAAVAVEWDLQRRASTQVTVTDNIGLDPDSAAESGVVFRANAGGRLTLSGRRLNLTSDSTLSLVRQSDRNAIELDHRVSTIGSFEFIRNRLGVDGSLFSTRELQSAESRTSGTDSGSDLNSRTTITSASISPYWQQRYGTWAQSLVRFRHSEVIAADDSAGTSRDDTLTLQLVGGNDLHPWRPAVLAEWLNSDAEPNSTGVENDRTQYSITLSNQLALSRRYSLTASIGYDEVEASSQSRDLSGVSWTVGAIGNPGPRTSFEVAIGQRFNDWAVNGSASYAVTPRLTMRVNASHSLTSGVQQLVTDRHLVTVDPITGELVTPAGLPTGFLDSELDNNLALRQDLQVTLVGNYGRNQVTVSALGSRRDFDIGEEQSIQTRASLTRSLSRTLSATASGSYRFIATAADRDTHTLNARFDLNYRLGPRTTLFGGYAFTDRRSNESTQEFSEHAATVGGRVTF